MAPYKKGPVFEAKLDAALAEITTRNRPVSTVAKEYGIARMTLVYRLQKLRAHDEVLKPYGSTKFTRAQEDMLADHVQRMANIGYGYTVWQVR